MTNIYQELTARAKVLEIIDRRRVETGDPALGSAIERVILDQCLAELEKSANNPNLEYGALTSLEPSRAPARKPC